ncbi:hypothetical protein TcCL_Unassigned05025 [Trypanosoma cruzi]|nr:hypothetical protein TcCL_Unassigned05025 [Trypanosoma cruzi]
MHKPRRRPTSHSSLTNGAPASSHWPNVLFVSDSLSQKLAAPLSQATGNGRARTPPSLVGKRPHWPAFAPEFPTNTDGCHDHCSPPPHAHAVAAARMPHSRHAKEFARKRLLLPLDPTTPRSDARQTARCAASTAAAAPAS